MGNLFLKSRIRECDYNMGSRRLNQYPGRTLFNSGTDNQDEDSDLEGANIPRGLSVGMENQNQNNGASPSQRRTELVRSYIIPVNINSGSERVVNEGNNEPHTSNDQTVERILEEINLLNPNNNNLLFPANPSGQGPSSAWSSDSDEFLVMPSYLMTPGRRLDRRQSFYNIKMTPDSPPNSQIDDALTPEQTALSQTSQTPNVGQPRTTDDRRDRPPVTRLELLSGASSANPMNNRETEDNTRVVQEESNPSPQPTNSNDVNKNHKLRFSTIIDPEPMPATSTECLNETVAQEEVNIPQEGTDDGERIETTTSHIKENPKAKSAKKTRTQNKNPTLEQSHPMPSTSRENFNSSESKPEKNTDKKTPKRRGRPPKKKSEVVSPTRRTTPTKRKRDSNADEKRASKRNRRQPDFFNM